MCSSVFIVFPWQRKYAVSQQVLDQKLLLKIWIFIFLSASSSCSRFYIFVFLLFLFFFRNLVKMEHCGIIFNLLETFWKFLSLSHNFMRFLHNFMRFLHNFMRFCMLLKLLLLSNFFDHFKLFNFQKSFSKFKDFQSS